MAARLGRGAAAAKPHLRATDPAYLAICLKVAPPPDDKAADDTTPGAWLARMHIAEVIALRQALEAAVAAAREGMPVMPPPLLEAYDGDDEADQNGAEDAPAVCMAETSSAQRPRQDVDTAQLRLGSGAMPHEFAHNPRRQRGGRCTGGGLPVRRAHRRAVRPAVRKAAPAPRPA